MFDVKPSEVKMFLPGDDGYKFIKDMIEYPRAAIIVTANCPDNYKQIVYTCQAKGWIKPVAYVPTSEYIWEELKR
ncbi:MAG: hypothetical protein EB127_06355 [Alphaproteobacteria bacterium]|nr:hypothetical protein [Alphaproteobacteria bacterium]